jgi:hypothetical protein
VEELKYSFLFRIEETWISIQPILFFVYLSQYAPNFARWFGKKVARKRMEALKSGGDVNKGLLSGFFSKKKQN